MPSKSRKKARRAVGWRGALQLEQVGERAIRSGDPGDLRLRPSMQKRLQRVIHRTKQTGFSLPTKRSSGNVRIPRMAIFVGAERSERTTVATVLASELNRPLYRIELSRVVSRYIGETEKNLGRLFDRAAQAGAILFFDEADALFGKRTEVKDAHDRYANRQRAAILERMRRYAGLTILSISRMGSSAAIKFRRCYWVIRFPKLTSKRRGIHDRG